MRAGSSEGKGTRGTARQDHKIGSRNAADYRKEEQHKKAKKHPTLLSFHI